MGNNSSSVHITKTNNPVQPEELCGASFLPNRLRIPIIWQSVGNFCRLLSLRADVVEDQPAQNGTDCSADDHHAELDNNIHAITSLLKRKLTAVKGAALSKLYQKKFMRQSLWKWKSGRCPQRRSPAILMQISLSKAKIPTPHESE